MPKRDDIHKLLILGSGPIVIGQACEFDYSGTQACKALREEGIRVVLLNSNPATIMTDPEMADRTYIEPITPEAIDKVLALERERGTPVDAILPIGLDVPRSGVAHSWAEARDVIEQVHLPVAIRPAYTLGGTGGGFAN